MSGQCPSCGHRIATVTVATSGPAHCPRCGDPLPITDSGPTVTAAPPPEPALGSTAPDFPIEAREPDQSQLAQLPSIPGYEVLEIIGRGGMGVVYKARQLAPRRIVALKMILGGGGRSERFRSEVAAVARLQHPNVVQIHEVGESDGRSYFAMEYVPGGSLAMHLCGGQLPTRSAAEIVGVLARAVQHAHERGIVHRDLKPANILLTQTDAAPAGAPGDGSDSAFLLRPSAFHPKIADFGLAKHLEGIPDGSGPQTQSGAILGTPNYMAPEQAKGRVKAIGPAVDVWALGAILYECLIGRPPFREDSPLDTLMKVISEDPPPPRQLRSAVPRDLEVICLKCLRKEPSERYESAGALADDLERFLDGRPIAARARTARSRAREWVRRRRESLFLAAGAALVVVAVLVALALWPNPRFTPPAPVVSGTNLPPDLQLVSPNALVFATVRGADLWGNPALRELADHLDRADGRKGSLDHAAEEIERMTTLHPSNIERATFVISEDGGDRWPLVVLATARPYSLERLREKLVNGGRHLPQPIGALTVYVPAERFDTAFFPVSDRILVMGDTDGVWKIANQPAHGSGALTPVLERAAEGHTLVIGARPPRTMVREILTRDRLLPRAEPVVALDTLGVVADIGAPTGPNGTVTIELAGTVAFPSAEQAEAARAHLPEVLRALFASAETGSDFRPLGQALAPLLVAAREAPWERADDTLRAGTRVDIDLATIKAHFDEMFREGKESTNMRTIATALQRYHDKHGRYPPAVVTDANGKPLYSWRVLLLPYLNEEPLYRQFHLNRAWDHPSNRPLLDRMPAVFAAAGAKPGTNTPYQVLTGEGGLFDAPEGRCMTDIIDGTERTILFVEAAEAVPWTQPRDVAFAPDRAGELGRAGAPGFLVAFASGTVRRIPRSAATPALLRGLFTRAGGEVVNLP